LPPSLEKIDPRYAESPPKRDAGASVEDAARKGRLVDVRDRRGPGPPSRLIGTNLTPVGPGKMLA